MNSQPKVLFALKSPGIGGAELQLLMLAKGLRTKHNIYPVFLFIGNSGKVALLRFLEEELIPYYHFDRPNSWKGLLTILWNVRRLIIKEGVRAIVSFLDNPSLITCLAKETLSRPIIHVFGVRSSKISFVPHRWYQFALKKTNFIVCNSMKTKSVYEELLKGLNISKDIMLINNGVELPIDSLEVSKPERSQVTFCMLASNREPKRYDLLIDWFGQFLHETELNALLLIAGWNTEKLNNVIRSKKLEDNIQVLGQVNNIHDLLSKNVDIGVLISDWEGQPNAVIEYMASSLPIIASDIPEIRDCLSESNANYVVSDSKSFINKAKILCEDSSIRNGLGFKNREKALHNYSIDGMVSAYWRLLEGNLK